jgi:triosephosphate isomerase
MRRYAIFGNWKMNESPAEAAALAGELKAALAQASAVEVAVFPTALALGAVAAELAGSGIGVGSQNIHFEAAGAFTGEISAGMVRAAGGTYTLVGHSERRQLFGETDAWVNLKLRAALEAGLGPVVCVGETLGERDSGQARSVVQRQVGAAFEGIDAARARGVILAYEPVWAIGTGRTATPQQAQEMHAFIRELLAGRFGAQAAESMRIQYGGSVKPDNVAGLLSQADVDGALVGGASLDAQAFAAIVGAAA